MAVYVAKSPPAGPPPSGVVLGGVNPGVQGQWDEVFLPGASCITYRRDFDTLDYGEVVSAPHVTIIPA